MPKWACHTHIYLSRTKKDVPRKLRHGIFHHSPVLRFDLDRIGQTIIHQLTATLVRPNDSVVNIYSHLSITYIYISIYIYIYIFFGYMYVYVLLMGEILHQLIRRNYHFCRVLNISGGAGFLPSTVALSGSFINLFSGTWLNNLISSIHWNLSGSLFLRENPPRKFMGSFLIQKISRKTVGRSDFVGSKKDGFQNIYPPWN